MSWDAPPPGEPEQPPQPYFPTQPYGQPTQPYGQPAQPYGQPAQPYDQTQTQYGQTQAYDQTQPYGQAPPQWSHPQEGPYGGPGPYFPPYPDPNYPPPKRRRTGFAIALGAVAVVVAAGVAVGVATTSSSSGKGASSALGISSSAAATTTATATATATTDGAPTDAASGDGASPASGSNTSQSGHTVIAPTSAGPLNLLSNADTARRIANIESSLSGNAVYGNPKIGFYAVGSDSSFSVWMLAESSSDAPAFKTSVNVLGDAAMARQIANGAKMTDVTTESPGPLGGALLCGRLAINGGEFRVCEWVDDNSFGWVYFMPSVSNSDVLTYTLDLRRAAEQ